MSSQTDGDFPEARASLVMAGDGAGDMQEAGWVAGRNDGQLGNWGFAGVWRASYRRERTHELMYTVNGRPREYSTTRRVSDEIERLD